MSTQTEPLRHEIVVVTGASTGIGAATARELARRGFHVLAGVRRGTDADALRATNLEPIMLDVTNEAEIAALVKRIAEDPERRPLRALVNNASLVTTRASPLRTAAIAVGAWATHVPLERTVRDRLTGSRCHCARSGSCSAGS